MRNAIAAMKKRNRTVTVNDRMQRGYRYVLTQPTGRNFDPEFRPELSPKQMLELGIFCGKYMTDCRKEFPISWFKRAKLSRSGRNCKLNFFAWMPVNRYRCGVRKAGFTPMTRADGFNGTAAITWDDEWPMKTCAKSSVGKLCDGTSRRSNVIVRRAI